MLGQVATAAVEAKINQYLDNTDAVQEKNRETIADENNK